MNEDNILYAVCLHDVEAQVGRPITDDEFHTLEKALELALADVVPDVITQVFGTVSNDD